MTIHQKDIVEIAFYTGRTPPLYDQVIILYSNTFKVKKGNQWGVIDKKGKVLTQCIYCETELNNRLGL